MSLGHSWHPTYPEWGAEGNQEGLAEVNKCRVGRISRIRIKHGHKNARRTETMRHSNDSHQLVDKKMINWMYDVLSRRLRTLESGRRSAADRSAHARPAHPMVVCLRNVGTRAKTHTLIQMSDDDSDLDLGSVFTVRVLASPTMTLH